MTTAMSIDDSRELASDAKLAEWSARFAAYRKQPTTKDLIEWLKCFKPEHLAAAHKLLDAVILVSEIDAQLGYKKALEGLPGWSHSAANRKGRWYFVGCGSAGESGPAMLRIFREANGMTADRWQSFFVTTKELPRLALSAYDQVVFVDDFAGTGTQITEYWPIMEEMVASEAKCYLLLTAITSEALQKISQRTELSTVPSMILPEESNIFSDKSDLFTDEERVALEEYGRVAWSSNPRGFGGCGLALVLSHKTPNNTVPILHANHGRWVGPFPRNLIRAA